MLLAEDVKANSTSMSLLQNVVEQFLEKIIAKYDPHCKDCGISRGDEKASGSVVEQFEAMMAPGSYRKSLQSTTHIAKLAESPEAMKKPVEVLWN